MGEKTEAPGALGYVKNTKTKRMMTRTTRKAINMI
jgi:hypothetical protein